MSINQEYNYFSWSTNFDASVIIDDCVYPNSYTITFNFLPKTSEVKMQNAGFEKIKYLFNNLCENSVIFSLNNNTRDVWFKMPINKILLPGNPYDQLLGVVLFKKMESIAGDFFHLEDLIIDSKLGDNVKYTINNESAENNHLNVKEWVDEIYPWWNRDDTATFDQRIDPKTYWTGAKSWKDLGYGKHTDKTRSFTPTIIDGGREK